MGSGCREPPPSSSATAAPAARPGALAHSPTFSQPRGHSGLPSPPLPHTHTRSHTLTPGRSSLPHSPGVRARARARPRSHTARATPAEAAPRCPRPRRRVQSPGARPGPALQARLRGGRGLGGLRGEGPGLPAESRPAGLTPGVRHLGWEPSSLHRIPTRGHRRPQGLRTGDGARALGGKRERESASRTRFSPPAPKPSSLRRGSGWGARFVPSSKPRD